MKLRRDGNQRREFCAGENRPNPCSNAGLGLHKDKLATAVSGIGRLVMARIDGLVFAVADGLDSVVGEAELDELLAERQGAALAQRAIVLGGASLVAMSLHEHFKAGLIL